MTPERLAEIRHRDEIASDLSRSQSGGIAKQDRRELLVEVDRLRGLLAEAHDDIGSWGAYASNYFQEKWDLESDLAKYREFAVTES